MISQKNQQDEGFDCRGVRRKPMSGRAPLAPTMPGAQDLSSLHPETLFPLPLTLPSPRGGEGNPVEMKMKFPPP